MMLSPPDLRRSMGLAASWLAAVTLAGCATGEPSLTGHGGSNGSGGFESSGGAIGSGGSSHSGGTTGTGGSTGGSTGGNTGGTLGCGGARGGTTGTGMAGSTGTTGSGGGAAVMLDCNATMPSGGTSHTGNTQGTAAGMNWQLWSNGSGGSITTFSTPAFSASWGPNSGDFLARIGLSWGNSGKAYTSLGT